LGILAKTDKDHEQILNAKPSKSKGLKPEFKTKTISASLHKTPKVIMKPDRLFFVILSSMSVKKIVPKPKPRTIPIETARKTISLIFLAVLQPAKCQLY
jgi:hypothetical protein